MELQAKLEAKRITRKAIFDDIESLRDNEAKADREIAALEKQIAASEVTYSIGDRFNYMGKEKIILVQLWLGLDGNRYVIGFVRLRNGGTWNGSFKAKDATAITPSEIADDIGCLVRYWDARKQEKC